MDGYDGRVGKSGNSGKNFLGVLYEVDGDLSKLIINVQGSNGQKGQDGGNGRDGFSGAYFLDYDVAENGGNGGNGGAGGNPGKSGYVKIYQAYEKNSFIEGKDYNVSQNNSVKGNDGIGGKGGYGGYGWYFFSEKKLYGKSGINGEIGLNTSGIEESTDSKKIDIDDVQNNFLENLNETTEAAFKFLNRGYATNAPER